MRVLLFGRWPPLKPFPVFKYEADGYRASVEFDKLRGEWVCRKTSLPSNKILELRGGLTEITMALPNAQSEAFAECAAAEHPEEELEKDARRRRQAMLEWRDHYENGALFADLQNYLSQRQHAEIEEILRLTLTARQLQCNPKNIAYVFDALAKAGGKLAALLEIAQRNQTNKGAPVPAEAKAVAPEAERYVPAEAIQPSRDRRRQLRKTPATPVYVELGDNAGGLVLDVSETGLAVAAAVPLMADHLLPRICFPLPNSGPNIEVSAQIMWLAESKKSAGIQFTNLTAEGREQIANWIASEEPSPDLARLTWTPVEIVRSAAVEILPDEPMESFFPEEEQPSSAELTASTTSQTSSSATPQILSPSPPLFVEKLQEEVRQRAPIARFGRQGRTGQNESSAQPMENSPSRPYVLEISGIQVVAVVFFALLSLAAALTVGRTQLGKRLLALQKSTPPVAAQPSPPLNRPSETSSPSAPPAANTFPVPEANLPAPATAAAGSPSQSPSAQPLDTRPEAPPTGAGTVAASPQRDASNGLLARNAPPPVKSQASHLSKTGDPMSAGPANPAPRRVPPAMRAARHLSSPSTILVSGPGDGSKPFRLTLPEKPIAASSSFAMTSQLSVLVPPEPGSTPNHRSARLQAGELVSFVWPRYPRPGDRHASSETVKVRTTIGELGQVLDVKHVSGSLSLFPAATSAIRQWRYKPTLLNSRPVQAQQEVTIEFRPPQHLPRPPAEGPSHGGK